MARAARLVEADAIPHAFAGDLAPLVVGRGVDVRACIHRAEEVVFAHGRERLGGVLKQLLVRKDRGDRRVGMVLVEVLEIRGIDRPLEAVLAEHVELKLQRPPLTDEAVLRPQVMQLGSLPCDVVVGEQERQQGHEVRLARAEAAVQVGALRAAVPKRTVHEPDRLIEGIREARRDDVRVDGLPRMGDTLGEGDGEVHLADLVGEIEEIADSGHAGPGAGGR